MVTLGKLLCSLTTVLRSYPSKSIKMGACTLNGKVVSRKKISVSSSVILTFKSGLRLNWKSDNRMLPLFDMILCWAK